MGTVFQVAKKETGEVGVHTLVARDEFVGKGKTRHETLLEPEHGSKQAQEEDTFDSSEGYQVFAKACIFVGNAVESPVGLALNAGNCLNGVEKIVSLSRV